ncbi:MAG TPA: MurR/RpiR family transcriptional regulator [Pyrinomonadaceae bacterium]|nr:MurR/RpiR family transcriptional regulator [Pyrinomonadaceae bacterium]
MKRILKESGIGAEQGGTLSRGRERKAQPSPLGSTRRIDSPTNGTPLDVRLAEAKSNLSSSRKKLLQRILDESDETYFLSSRDMGRRYDVNSATIIRTIQALGYEKFAEFAHDLREHFVTKITPYTAMKSANRTDLAVTDRVRQSLDKDLENLNALRASIDPEKVAELANRINLSQRIIVVGIDFAASLANSLAYALVRLGFDVDAPVGSSGVIQNRIRILTSRDLLIAISFGRGLRETIEAAKSARRRNVPSFGITNGDATPIAKYCDSYLIASIARTSFIDSYVAPVAAINAILVACAHIQSDRSLEHLRQFEEEYASSTRWYSDDNNEDG